MKLLVQQIGVWVWVIYFGLSISGINLQQLYCHCTDKAYVSLFEIENDCGDHHTAVVKEKSCCEKRASQRSCHAEKTENKDCCDSKSNLVKADIDVLYSSTIPVLPAITKIVLPSTPFSNFNFTKNLHTDTIPLYHPPPPKRYGKVLRDFVQSYLC